MDFADRLRQKREAKSLSRDKLARLIGCSASYISSIEQKKQGAKNPTKDFIVKASGILSVTTDWPLTGEERIPTLEQLEELLNKATTAVTEAKKLKEVTKGTEERLHLGKRGTPFVSF